MPIKIDSILLFFLVMVLILSCGEIESKQTLSKKIILNNELHLIISELEQTMEQLRGDLIQSASDSNYQKLKYLKILEGHRHLLTEKLNKLRYISDNLWKDYESDATNEISLSREELKQSLNYKFK
ncbi:MAG: hypothetical protein KJ571_06865 [Bacteroidetes bacterium]|nr:hypothetical protein [Bacteroidota bacterium]